MTTTHTHTASVNVTDDAKNVIAELDVTITFRVIAGHPKTSATPAEPDELEIETVVCADTGKDAPDWAWDMVNDGDLDHELWEVADDDKQAASESRAEYFVSVRDDR